MSRTRLQLLGENIKKYREQKGLKQTDIALGLDCSQEYICRVERGQKYLGLRKLFEIANILNVECSNLINFK